MDSIIMKREMVAWSWADPVTQRLSQGGVEKNKLVLIDPNCLAIQAIVFRPGLETKWGNSYYALKWELLKLFARA